MRKLSTLVLVALLAAPALCLAATNGPDDVPTTAESSVIWVALGHTPMAVTVAPPPRMVTICYYGVTMMVREKIAKRYLKIGARCGSCEMEDHEGPTSGLTSAVGRGGVCEEKYPCDSWLNLAGAAGAPCDDIERLNLAPVSAEKAVQIGQ